MGHQDEAELREYLIKKDTVKVSGRGGFLTKNILIDSYAFSRLLKEEIVKENPRADFNPTSKAPHNLVSFLNGFKPSLIDSCLLDLEDKLNTLADTRGYITEIKIKETFGQVFPNFPATKIESLLAIIDNKKKPTAQNMYQEKFEIEELMSKIKMGDSYKGSDLETVVAVEKVNLLKEGREKEKRD